MITIPVSKPTRAQLITAVSGAALAAVAYFAPALLPALAPIAKLLWASGIFAAGAGTVQVVKAPS